MNKRFWKDKTVFLTGHTGFKGAWLSLWLESLGAKVFGYALEPATTPNLFDIFQMNLHSTIGDIRDLQQLTSSMKEAAPDIVMHLAAQPLVRDSYSDPVNTFSTNVLGTVNVLEAIRSTPSVKSVIVVTSDKCYDNKETNTPYTEADPMGGYDPYSSSKGCAELVTHAYTKSFFNEKNYGISHHVAVASARAGNIIGGGDWSKDRLIPDILNSAAIQNPLVIRNPKAIRPWQYILDALHGYLLLAENLYNDGPSYSGAWNFGPEQHNVKPVSWIVDKFQKISDGKFTWSQDPNENPHEATYLKLDASKAKSYLNWKPLLNIEDTLADIYDWHQCHAMGKNMLKHSMLEIEQYEQSLEQKEVSYE